MAAGADTFTGRSSTSTCPALSARTPVRRSGAGRGGGASVHLADYSYGKGLVAAMLVNLLNPKTALFDFAFLPQSVDPDCGSVTGKRSCSGA